VVIEQEPGSGGKNQVAEIQQYLAEESAKYPELIGVKVEGRRPTDRVAEAYSWFGDAQQGKIWIGRGDWNDKFYSQLDGFTQSKHDDRITSASGAYACVRPFKIWKKVPFLSMSNSVKLDEEKKI
jgi:phage terminase large subunit-like protein